MLVRSPDMAAAGMKPAAAPQRRRRGRQLRLSIAAIMLLPLLFCGCSHLNDQTRPTFLEANDLFSRGEYAASLGKYQQIIEQSPAQGDRVLFEMGIIHAYPGNEQKDYQRALECFRKIIRDYPGSGYRKDSELMVFNIGNVIAKDRTIAAQQAQIEALRQEVGSRGVEAAGLQKKVETLEQELKGKEAEVTALKKDVVIIPKGPADRILIEKKERRMTLYSKGRALKSYQIALGGNPTGPKERQGDNKTPEGIYRIDARNRNSQFHLSLHISYPNEKDKKRARELGVSPGGDIMIHGLKNGLSWVGEQHTELDWTKGCVAVTDEEIEEIDKVVPLGTVVEILP